jgi:hypothetical protein
MSNITPLRPVPDVQSRLTAREKQRQALELRKAGATYRQIAESVGYRSASSAYTAVKKAFNEVIQEPVEEIRAMQVERVQHMILALWPAAQSGDPKSSEVLLKWIDKLDRLMGTEAPRQVEHSVNGQIGVLSIGLTSDDYIEGLKSLIPPPPQAVEVIDVGPGRPLGIGGPGEGELVPMGQGEAPEGRRKATEAIRREEGHDLLVQPAHGGQGVQGEVLWDEEEEEAGADSESLVESGPALPQLRGT